MQRVDPIILDVNIVYQDGPPNIWEFLCGRTGMVHMEIRPIASIPLESNELKRWVESYWKEKDERIGGLRRLY